MKRTRAIEILTEKSVAFEVRAFEAARFTAEEAAEALQLPLASIFKTLVVRGSAAGEAMALVPGDRELNLRKLAAACGEKRVDLVPVQELQRLTGYLKGGVSPLGGKRVLPIYIDASARQCSLISISAGLRGVQILIAPEALIRASGARVAELV
jgi:Cys-tRNA(Pro)/Cys-tRNA(Cys) deacylase